MICRRTESGRRWEGRKARLWESGVSEEGHQRHSMSEIIKGTRRCSNPTNQTLQELKCPTACQYKQPMSQWHGSCGDDLLKFTSAAWMWWTRLPGCRLSTTCCWSTRILITSQPSLEFTMSGSGMRKTEMRRSAVSWRKKASVMREVRGQIGQSGILYTWKMSRQGFLGLQLEDTKHC